MFGHFTQREERATWLGQLPENFGDVNPTEFQTFSETVEGGGASGNTMAGNMGAEANPVFDRFDSAGNLYDSAGNMVGGDIVLG